MSEHLPTTSNQPHINGVKDKTTREVGDTCKAQCCSRNSIARNGSQRSPLSCPNQIASLLKDEANYSPQPSKRSDYIPWDEYFLAAASLSAMRSKDPVNATGACLVDPSNRIIGTGYNGFPSGCDDDLLPWANVSVENILHTKSPYEVHAEVNAVLNKCAPDCVGARLYTRQFPCNECAKILIQSGVAEVVYTEEPEDCSSLRASRILLHLAGIRTRQHTPTLTRVRLNFDVAEVSDDSDTRAERIKTKNHKVDPNDREMLLKESGYDPTVSTKRNNYLSWDDYFVAVRVAQTQFTGSFLHNFQMAFLTAKRSKDPNTQVGACIVDTNKRIVGLGYNGFPSGCNDDILPWARNGLPLHTKYPYVTHAEVNAIMNKGSGDVKNSTMYVALFPCNECAKIIIQAGIREVVYLSDRYHDTEACRASRILFNLAGVKLRKHVPQSPEIVVNLVGR